MEQIIKTGGGDYINRLSVTLANGKQFSIAPKIKTLTCDGNGYHIENLSKEKATDDELARLHEIICEHKKWLDS